MKLTMVIFSVLLLVMLSTTVKSQTSDSAMSSVCAAPYPVATTTNTAAGYINWCVYYPKTAMAGSTVRVFSILTAPSSVAPAFATSTGAFSVFSGCTEGTPVNVVPTTNGAAGTMVTHASSFTITGEICDGSAAASLTVGTTPAVQIYISALPITILTESIRVDNFNYLCTAPNIAPGMYSTTTTTCLEQSFSEQQSFSAVVFPLLLLAIAFFVVMGETRKDALYWFIAMILSIYLLIERNNGSGIIPIAVYLGWIFITLYQAISLLMTKRAQNLSNTEE